jgi:hypothetical protein
MNDADKWKRLAELAHIWRESKLSRSEHKELQELCESLPEDGWAHEFSLCECRKPGCIFCQHDVLSGAAASTMN